MNILITGGNGFIAREIIAAVSSENKLIVCMRQLSSSVLFKDNIQFIQADFTKDTDKAIWKSRLNNIDVVINCVGVFQTATKKEMWDVHCNTPRALFDACVERGVKKIIQISALGVDKSDVDYAQSKLAAEKYLEKCDIDFSIIRPSFVYGSGCYGGSALFRGLCGMPFFLFLPGGGKKLLQPVHVADLAMLVKKALHLSGKNHLYAAGSEKLSLKEILNKMRAWLGFKKAISISVPIIFIQIAAKFGDFFRNSPLSTTGVKLMNLDNVISDAELEATANIIGFTPRSYTEGLSQMISGVQDRWHARLFFLRPLLRLSIAFLWIFSGIVSLFEKTISLGLLDQAGISVAAQPLFLYGASFLDIVLGVAVLMNYRLKIIGSAQIVLIFIFTLFISIYFPQLWLHPFAPIAKNIPLIFATLAMMALESDR